MFFVLKAIFKDRNSGDNHSHPIGIIQAESDETAAEKAGRIVEGRGTGPDGHQYCQLSNPKDNDPFPYPLVMNFLPEISSEEDLEKIEEFLKQ